MLLKRQHIIALDLWSHSFNHWKINHNYAKNEDGCSFTMEL